MLCESHFAIKWYRIYGVIISFKQTNKQKNKQKKKNFSEEEEEEEESVKQIVRYIGLFFRGLSKRPKV